LVVRGLAPFRVSKVEGVGGNATVSSLSTDLKAVHVLTISIKPDPKGKIPSAVRIHTDAKDQAILEIPVMGDLAP
jgi:hypothetical protein